MPTKKLFATHKVVPWYKLDHVPGPVISSDTTNQNYDLYEEAKLIRDALGQSVDTTHPLLVMFNLAAPDVTEVEHGGIPHAKGLRRAFAEWEKLPLQDQQKIMNGWRFTPRRKRESREMVLSELDEQGSLRVTLHIGVWERREEVKASIKNTLATTDEDIVVQIRWGTSRWRVTNMLRDIIAEVESSFDKWITHSPPARH
jgi:hypothetical protein